MSTIYLPVPMVVANDRLVSNVLVPEICTTQVSLGTDPSSIFLPGYPRRFIITPFPPLTDPPENLNFEEQRIKR